MSLPLSEQHVLTPDEEGVARRLENKGEKALAGLVRKYGVVGAFCRVEEVVELPSG